MPVESRLYYDLGRLILLVVHQLVTIGRFFQRHAMADQESCVDLLFDDCGQQRPQIALKIGLPGLGAVIPSPID